MKILAAFTFLIFPALAAAQPPAGFSDQASSHSYSSVAVNDTTTDDRVVHPAADPFVFYDPNDSDYEFQSGLFVSTRDLGAEMTVNNRHYNLFATVFASSMIRSKERITDGGNVFNGGVTFGREFQLHVTGDYQDGARFYARAGPGFGIAGVGRSRGAGTDYHYGIYASALIGVTRHFSNAGTPYVEIGFKTAWFPSLNDVGILGAPQVSIGFRFSGSGDILPVRF